MEICFLQNEGQSFDFELFDKFTSFTITNIQHFHGMQMNFICNYLQTIQNNSNAKVREKVNIFCDKIYEKLRTVKKQKMDILDMRIHNQWKEFFQPNIFNVADHIYITFYENFLNEEGFRVLNENMGELSNKMMEIKTVTRLLYVYYSRFINYLIHKISIQKHLLIKYELSRYGKTLGSPLDIFIHQQFLIYLELNQTLNQWRQNLFNLNADMFIKKKEKLEIDEHIYLILYKYYDMLFNFQYKLPVSVIEESKNDENIAKIINDSRAFDIRTPPISP